MDLPLLETLHLNKVYFEHHEYLVKLLSSCPILEDLQLKCLYIPDFLVGKEKFNSLPSLKSLYVEFVWIYHVRGFIIRLNMFLFFIKLRFFEFSYYIHFI
jgi:hypothetical protein